MDNIDARFAVEVRDENGDIVDAFERKSDSFTKNFLLLLKAAFSNANVTVKRITGEDLSTKGFSAYPTGYNQTDRSIVLGAGTAAVTADDYALESEFSTGVLRYSPVMIAQPTAPTYSEGVISNTMFIRSFVNVSGEAITVNELGVKFYAGSNGILILRDVLETGVVVGAGYSITVSYDFRTAI